MESISLTLIILSFLETFILVTLVYSLLSIKKFDHRFFILVVLLTIVQLTVRNLPVIPFVIMFSIILVYAVYFKYIYNTSIFTTTIIVIMTYLLYSFIEGLNMSISPEILGVHYDEVLSNPSLRFQIFSIQAFILLIIIGLVNYFKINFKELMKFFDFEDLKILADDEMDFSRERRIVATFFLVMIFY